MVRNLFGHVEDSAQTISKKIDEIKNDVSDFSIGSTIKIENEFFKKKKATSTYITKTLVVVTDKSDAIGQKTTGLYDDLSKTISTSFDTLNSKKSKLIDKIQSKKSRTKDKVSDVTDKVFEDISEGYDNIKLSPKECKQIIANLGSIFSGPLLTFIVKAIKNPVLQGESCRNNKVLRNYALFASHVYRKHGTDLPEGWNEVMEFDDLKQVYSQHYIDDIIQKNTFTLLLVHRLLRTGSKTYYKFRVCPINIKRLCNMLKR